MPKDPVPGALAMLSLLSAQDTNPGLAKPDIPCKVPWNDSRGDRKRWRDSGSSLWRGVGDSTAGRMEKPLTCSIPPFCFSAGLTQTVKCAHERSVHLFIDSLRYSQKQITGYWCKNMQMFDKGRCLDCRANRCNTLGYHIRKARVPGSQRLFLKTQPQMPFKGWWGSGQQGISSPKGSCGWGRLCAGRPQTAAAAEIPNGTSSERKTG